MTKISALSKLSVLCLASAFCLTLGVSAHAAPKKASVKGSSEKSATKKSTAKADDKASPEKASASTGDYISVTKNGAKIYAGPDTKKEVLWTVFKGYPLQITSRQGKWAQVVDVEGDKGWISTDLIAKQKTFIVKANTANLRVGAGKDYEIVAEVKRGVVFKPLATEGDWTKVKHADGTSGWILNKLLWPN